MRGATRRAQTATPGVPCLACTGQIDMSEVALEMSGDLDDPEYIRRAGRSPVSGRPNVAALCAGVSSSQLEQFVSLVAHPAGRGVPGALRFSLALHHLEHLPHRTQDYCATEREAPMGDSRIDLRRPAVRGRQRGTDGRRDVGSTMSSTAGWKRSPTPDLDRHCCAIHLRRQRQYSSSVSTSSAIAR